MCVYVCGHVCHAMHVVVRGQLERASSLCTMWVHGLKCRSSDLVVNTCTRCLAIPGLFLHKLCCLHFLSYIHIYAPHCTIHPCQRHRSEFYYILPQSIFNTVLLLQKDSPYSQCHTLAVLFLSLRLSATDLSLSL